MLSIALLPSLRKISLALVALTSLAFVATSAQGQVTLYTDRASFDAATTGVTTIGFEGIAPPVNFADFSNAAGLTLSGVNFTGPTGGGYALDVVDPAYSPPLYDWGSGAVLLGPYNSADARIVVTLPVGVTAVGSDIMSIIPYADTFTVNLSTGSSFTVASSNYPNRAFVGFTSSTAISSITFRTTSAYPELDNFSFGSIASTSAVPEPGSIALLVGMTTTGGVFALRKRRARK